MIENARKSVFTATKIPRKKFLGLTSKWISMLDFGKIFGKMGMILPKFRKKTSVELLENINEEIKELEACHADTEERHKKITRQLMFYSAGICVLLGIFLYCWIPSEMQQKIIWLTISVLSPLLLCTASRIISWYYESKIRSSTIRLRDLKKKKKELIDEIMDKETYKMAKTILEKYAPETLPNNYPENIKFQACTKSDAPPFSQQQQFRQVHPHGRMNANRSLPKPPMPPMLQLSQPSLLQNMSWQSASEQSRVMTAPMLPGSKSYIERMFEYLIGEGPSNKYALICTSCKVHNGMALMEEFEYTAFKCYACNVLNPARKQRPLAPKLECAEAIEEHSSDTGLGVNEVKCLLAEAHAFRNTRRNLVKSLGSGDVESVTSEHEVEIEDVTYDETKNPFQGNNEDDENCENENDEDGKDEAVCEDEASNFSLYSGDKKMSEESYSLLSRNYEEVELSSSLYGNKSSESLCNGSNSDEVAMTDSECSEAVNVTTNAENTYVKALSSHIT